MRSRAVDDLEKRLRKAIILLKKLDKTLSSKPARDKMLEAADAIKRLGELRNIGG